MIANQHGGQLANIKDRFPHIKNWLDISTGISPWSYPCKIKTADLQALPDEDLLKDCETMAAKYFAVDEVIAGNGAQAFIRHLPRIAMQFFGSVPKIYTAEQTYSEYAIAATETACDVGIYGDYADLPEGAVVVLGNPNNPDGAMISEKEVMQISKHLGDEGLIVIDEAFCDLYPEQSLSHIKLPNLIVLKSFGKFFGLAGLRLGFAIAPKNILALFEKSFGVWAVSSPALLVAKKAYADSQWIESQRIRILQQAKKLQKLLQTKTEILTNQGLFITCQCDKDLFMHLAMQGIYIREFADYEDIYRFGLPANDEDFNKLKEALDSL